MVHIAAAILSTIFRNIKYSDGNHDRNLKPYQKHVRHKAYRFIISSALSLMYPPSMRPGVSIMFSVKPALDRDTITGLGPSDFSR